MKQLLKIKDEFDENVDDIKSVLSSVHDPALYTPVPVFKYTPGLL